MHYLDALDDNVLSMSKVKELSKPRPVGRPPRGKKPAGNRITIRLTDAELKDWTKRAGEMSLGEWIRQRCNA